MYEALNNQFINVVEDTYLKEWKNKYIFLLRVTCCNLLENLLDKYEKITTADLESNNQQMNKPIV